MVRNIVLSIFLMIIYGSVYSWGIFRIPVENTFGIGATLSGMPYMTFLVVYAVSMLLGGRYIGKYSSRLLLILGGIFISIGWVLSFFATNIFFLTFTYGILIGFGVGISYGIPIHILAHDYPNRKGLIIGIALSGFGLSPLITAPLGHWFIANYGLKETFLYYGLLFGMIIVSLSMLIKVSYGTKQEDLDKKLEDKHSKSIFSYQSFPFSYSCFLIGTLIGLTIIGLTSKVGNDVFGLSSQTIAGFMIVFALFNGAGRPLFGWVTEKFGSGFAMRTSYLLVVIASFTMLFANKNMLYLYVVVFSILWLNLGAWLSIAPIMTMQLYGMRSYSKNYGIMFTAYGLGALIGVVSTGLVIDVLDDYNLIFVLIIALSLIGVFLSRKVSAADIEPY